MNLNIELKDINIFIFKEKEKENNKNKNNFEKTSSDPNIVGKSLTFRTPSSPNPNTFFLSKSDFTKNYKKENNNKSSKLVSFNDERLTLPFIL